MPRARCGRPPRRSSGAGYRLRRRTRSRGPAVSFAALRADALACHAAALAAVEPGRLVAAQLVRDVGGLVLRSAGGAMRTGPVLVVGAGKGALAMARAAADAA